MYKAKINGISYEVTIIDGKPSYNPPLPKSVQKKSKARLNEMLSSGTAPGLRTDSTFHKGRGTLLDQLDGDEVYADYLVKQAAKKGYTVGANDIYLGQFDDSCGDPKAFFKPNEGLSEIKKRAEATGKGVDMPGLYVKPKEYTPKPKKLINEKIAKGLEKQYIQSGEAAGMTKKQLRQHVINKHARMPSA